MELNQTLTKAETSFNIAASIPVVAIVSSLVRNAASKVQMVAGAIIGLVGLIGQMVSDNKKWEVMAQKGLDHLVHGLANTVRAFGELLLALTIVGSLGLLAWQSASKNKFAPILKYDEPTVNIQLNPAVRQ